MANLLLAARVGSTSADLPTVGKNWIHGFLNARDGLKSTLHRKAIINELNEMIRKLLATGSLSYPLQNHPHPM